LSFQGTASAYESGGRRFESFRARQEYQWLTCILHQILKRLCPRCVRNRDGVSTRRGARSIDIIYGKGCVEVNGGDVVEFERLLTHPTVVCVRPIGQSQCFWRSPAMGRFQSSLM
jgi:hypothetical protein